MTIIFCQSGSVAHSYIFYLGRSWYICCAECPTVCKSKGGLTRHTKAKHSDKSTAEEEDKIQDFISDDDVNKIAKISIETASKNTCFPEPIIKEIESYKVTFHEDSMFFKKFRELYKNLSQNGNSEKFYSAFYQC